MCLYITTECVMIATLASEWSECEEEKIASCAIIIIIISLVYSEELMSCFCSMSERSALACVL
jgi:hypothetical protein